MKASRGSWIDWCEARVQDWILGPVNVDGPQRPRVDGSPRKSVQGMRGPNLGNIKP